MPLAAAEAEEGCGAGGGGRRLDVPPEEERGMVDVVAGAGAVAPDVAGALPLPPPLSAMLCVLPFALPFARLLSSKQNGNVAAAAALGTIRHSNTTTVGGVVLGKSTLAHGLNLPLIHPALHSGR